MIAKTPKPPYYAVVFTSFKTEGDFDYAKMSDKMLDLAEKQEGFLGVESVRNELGITVSYWESLEAIKKWKLHTEHTKAREKVRSRWYQAFN